MKAITSGSLPELLLILGTGWNSVAELIEVKKSFNFEEIFGVKASVPGHEGRLIIGKLSGKQVVAMVGRLHRYEGRSSFAATLPIRLLAKAGVKKIVVTSACGALNPKYRVGEIVVLKDMLTLFLHDSPLKGADFVDLSSVFDKNMMALVDNKYPRGVYAYYPGPQFETPADKRALLSLGADVVGMSTVPETIMAKSLGLKVLGLSFVTNLAFVKHDHRQVLAEAKKGEKRMKLLLEGVIKKL